MKRRLDNTILVCLLTAVGAFSYGFAASHFEVFPYGQVRTAYRVPQATRGCWSSIQ